MTTRLALLALVATLATGAHAAPIVLPDSCGKDIKFDVKTQKDQPPPAPPAEGKAQIVFIYTYHKPFGSQSLVMRFGVDGAWAGAASNDSYFTMDVPPGEHHVCMAGQGQFAIPKSALKDTINMATFTAESGKVYYFEYSVRITGVGASGNTGAYGAPAGTMSATRAFTQIDAETGKFRIKSSSLSTSQPQS